jgi:hypothetical protein
MGTARTMGQACPARWVWRAPTAEGPAFSPGGAVAGPAPLSLVARYFASEAVGTASRRGEDRAFVEQLS